MPNIIQGTFTIPEVFKLTKSYYRSRFQNRKRDHVKMIRIRKITVFNKDRKLAPIVKYEIISQSTPKYGAYINSRNKGRNIKHQYDIIFEIDELKLTSKNWKIRLGTGKSWKNAPQNQIDSIYRKNLQRWSPERIQRHRQRRHRYIDSGDWNAQYQGLNGDFVFRCAWVYKLHGHLYDRMYGAAAQRPPVKMNPKKIMFFPKHIISFLEILMNRGIFKRN